MVKPKTEGWLAETFAANLKHLRKKAGYTSHDFAMKAGISKGYMSELENGRSSPSLPVLQKIAEALNVQPFKLFRRKV